MITVRDVLKIDPYREIKGVPIYIDKKDFYAEKEGVYVPPSKDICERCCRSIEEGNSRIKLFHINGYAGCGKTLFAHYMMQRYSYDDDYYYEFDHGEGQEYSLSYIKEIMIRQLSKRMALIINDNPPILKEFYETGRLIYGESDDYKMLQELFYGDSWLIQTIEERLASLPLVQYSVTIKESMSLIADEKKYDINSIIKFLLFCDYLWRCSEVTQGMYGKEEKYIFCLLDNLDNLSRTAVVDLYVDLYDVISKLTEQNTMFRFFEDNKFSQIKCIVLFPTREVTQRRLLEGLRKRKLEYLLDNNSTIFSFDLEGKCASLDEIIASRKKYCSQKQLNADTIEKVELIESLMKIPYVNKQFSELLNGNYSYCVDRILDLWNLMPEWVEECRKMQKSKGMSSECAICSYEGTRGILLRMLLELFKERDVYNSVTDEDDILHFNVNGKLGLSELNCDKGMGEYNVSISRLLLTFIKGSNNHKVRINHIFKCFSHLDGYEICRYLYALSENIRDTWRRLIVFSSIIPTNVKDLYKQYDMFVSNNDTPATAFSEVELCLSGKTYIHTVVPNFEFFLSRINKDCGININPPLFSQKSLHSSSENIWAKSIETVLSSIEKCANEIYCYDAYMVDRCVKNNCVEYIEKLFVVSKTKYGISTKQSHLSRIIFSHISYIERFRRYLLYNMCPSKEQELSEYAIQINKQIISYILRYLILFDRTPFDSEYSALLNNEFLTEEYLDNFKNNKTCLDIFKITEISQLNRHISVKEEISKGYKNQKSAQNKLLEEILKIHNSHYSIISKIEIAKEKQS